MTAPDTQVWLHPSPRLWRLRQTEIAAVSALGALALGTGVGASSGGAAGGGAAVATVAGGLLCAWFARRRFGAWRYQERHEDLMVARGVMFRRLSVVPYGRMQFVEVTAGPVERIFGLSTVKLHTAAAASDARIPGLEVDVAQRLRDRLAQLGESKAAGM